MNAHIQEVIDHVDQLVESGILSGAAIRQIRAKLAAIPEQQCECPGCLHEELDGHGNQKPIDKLVCNCGGAACSNCLLTCADGACSTKICPVCGDRCEGCAEKFCAGHLTGGFCAECIRSMSPSEKSVWRRNTAPAYCFEGD